MAATATSLAPTQHYLDCNRYLDARVGTYDFRCRRYREIVDRLERMGLAHGDTIVDVGAGRCEFGRYLRESGWNCVYIPFDGSIDGVNLDQWDPPVLAEFHIAIEFIEHVHDPFLLLKRMLRSSTKGIAITTPNAGEVDVLGMDHTHISPVCVMDLESRGFLADAIRMFTPDKRDTIVAHKWKAA